jgi:hypothetical protein
MRFWSRVGCQRRGGAGNARTGVNIWSPLPTLQGRYREPRVRWIVFGLTEPISYQKLAAKKRTLGESTKHTCKLESNDSSVAVGTVVADRPPHRSVRALLTHTALPLDTSVEAHIRVRMQGARCRNPPVEDGADLPPGHPRLLAPASQYISP